MKLKDAPVKGSILSEMNELPGVKCFLAGISSVCGTFILLLVLLICFGAAIQSFEGDLEIQNNLEIVNFLEKLENNTFLPKEDFDKIVELIGFDRQGTEGFSTFIGNNNWIDNDIVSLISSISYIFDISATIGYGAIPAQTIGGKTISLLAVFILIPLTIVAYTHMAEFIENIIGNILISRDTEYQNVLKKYDKDKDGKIDVKELFVIFQDLGLQVTEEECKGIFNLFDLTDDHELDEKEFRQLCVNMRIRVGLLARPNLQLEVSLILFALYVFIYTMITRLTFINNVFDSFYFAIISVTTVGLGDFFPPQEYRGVFSLLTFLGIGFMALVLKAIVAIVYSSTNLQKRYFHRALEPIFSKRNGQMSFQFSYAELSALSNFHPLNSSQQLGVRQLKDIESQVTHSQPQQQQQTDNDDIDNEEEEEEDKNKYDDIDTERDNQTRVTDNQDNETDEEIETEKIKPLNSFQNEINQSYETDI